MKIQFAASGIAIGIALASMAAHAADQGPAPKQNVAVVKESEIKKSDLTARIRARLAEEKFSSLPNIKIESDAKGAVVMSGRVSSEQEADKIIFIVHRIEGVTAVRSLFSLARDK